MIAIIIEKEMNGGDAIILKRAAPFDKLLLWEWKHQIDLL